MSELEELFRPVVNEMIWAPDGGATTFTARIIGQVRDALFNDRLHVGDFLGSEKELVRIFGVSRITVRAALRTLEAMGIVEIRTGVKGGAQVADVNLDLTINAFVVQLHLLGVSMAEVDDASRAIECKGAELAAGNATVEDVRRLAGLLGEAENLKDEPAAFRESCHAFHAAIAEASHNRVIVTQFNAMRQTIWSRTAGGGPETADAEAIQRHHRSLYRLIETHDGSGARNMMLEHLAALPEPVGERPG